MFSRTKRLIKRLNPFAKSQGLRKRDYLMAAISNPREFTRAVRRYLDRRARMVEAVVRASENPDLRKPTPAAPQSFDALLAGLSRRVGVLELTRTPTYMRIGVGDIDLLSTVYYLANATPSAVVKLNDRKINLGMDKIKARIQSAKTIEISFNGPEFERVRIIVETYLLAEPGKWQSPNGSNRLMRAVYGDVLGQPGLSRAIDILGAPSLRARAEMEPVDAVYTWVNHEDPDWQAMYAAWKTPELPGDAATADPEAGPEAGTDPQPGSEAAAEPAHAADGGQGNTGHPAVAAVLLAPDASAPSDATPAADGAQAVLLAPAADAGAAPAPGPDAPVGKSDDSDAMSRFHNNDELRYSLRSLEQNLPWLRQIFVFSNCAPPGWLATDHPRLRWVRHEDIIPPEFLPTFSSHVIESFLHRIPGLAERFIYLNDDFFVARGMSKMDFFTETGQSQALLENYGMVSGEVREGDPDYLNAARNSAALVRETFGFAPTQLHRHVPYALRRSVLEEIEDRFRARIDAFRVNRFRRPNDVNIPSFLYHHYAMGSGRAVTGSKESILVKSNDLKWRTRLKDASNKKYHFICINEGGAEEAPSSWHASVQKFLKSRFPRAAAWEIPPEPDKR